MKILITGICGFVGSALTEAWLNAEPGIAICGIDNFIRPGSEHNRGRLKKLGIKIYHGDIRSSSDFDAFPKADWVIDAAANPSVLAGIDGQASSRQLIEHNLQGTVNILEYCKRNGAGFILLSTSRVYSISPLASLPVVPQDTAFKLRNDTQLPAGVSAEGVNESFSTARPYPLREYETRFRCLRSNTGQPFGFPVWIDRCGVLAGAGQFGKADQGIFSFWINSYLRRRPLAYIGFGGNGYQVRDCLHPRDLIPLVRKQVLAPGGKAQVINLGGGKKNAMSLAELSAWCSDRFGSHIVASNSRDRQFDIPWLIMDSSLARALWNWEPETSLSANLAEIAVTPKHIRTGLSFRRNMTSAAMRNNSSNFSPSSFLPRMKRAASARLLSTSM
jgi:CDP-paratose 2-epimerase